MKIDQKKIQNWFKNVVLQLPKLDVILKKSLSEVLIIGAGVFEIYQELGWIPPFRRKTGDIDLSVGLAHGTSDYEILRNALLENGYTNNNHDPHYRYFSPKRIPGAMTYIDLLAHPTSDQVSESQATKIMGAGPDFSFEGYAFTLLETYKIMPHLSFPNPFGVWALKKTAYLDDPIRRVKDLADIIELGSGLVEKGMHFDLGPLWMKLKTHTDAKNVRTMLADLASGESTRWDIEEARQELLKRGYVTEAIDELLPQRLSDLVDFL